MKPQHSAQGVSIQFLLEGAVYALEQAGLLLHDALILYQHHRYGSAIIMVLFSREEIGRYQLIRQQRREMIENGHVITVKDIKQECYDHVEKQKLGHIGSVIKTSPGEQLWDLLTARTRNHPQNAEYQEADKYLHLFVERMNRKVPQQRHELRQKALYVEPSDSEEAWNLPKNKAKVEAFKEIEGASNAYGMALDRFTRGDDYYHEDPTFYDGLKAWIDRPPMPSPLGSLLSLR